MLEELQKHDESLADTLSATEVAVAKRHISGSGIRQESGS